jgi:hypothetical protein
MGSRVQPRALRAWAVRVRAEFPDFPLGPRGTLPYACHPTLRGESTRAMVVSFIESPFPTRAEYNAYVALPPAEQAAALEAAAAPAAPAAADALAASTAALSVADGGGYDVLAFPPARLARLREEFEAAAKGGRLELRAVHKLTFTPVERAEYDFDTWDEDLQATCAGCRDDMAWADLEAFLKENL